MIKFIFIILITVFALQGCVVAPLVAATAGGVVYSDKVTEKIKEVKEKFNENKSENKEIKKRDDSKKISNNSTTSNEIQTFENYAINISKELLKRVPDRSTFAIKLVSTKDYLPDESLRLQVETSMAAALQKTSGYKAVIVPRSAVKTLWSEKQIFDGVSSSDIDKFFSKLSADYLIAIQFRPFEADMIASIQVFDLQGTDSGKLAFSSQASSVTINANLTSHSAKNKVDSIKELKFISEQISQLNNHGGIISKAKTYSQIYHNARILSQRGEIDLALKTYEQLLKNKLQFADALIDTVDLLKRLYGNESAKIYIEKNYRNKIPDLSYKFAVQYLSEKPLEGIWNLPQDIKYEFPPLLMLYFKKCDKDLTDIYNHNFNTSNTTKNCRKLLMNIPANDAEINKLKELYKNGIYLNYFIDTNKGIKEFESFDRKIDIYFGQLEAYLKFAPWDNRPPLRDTH